ncbi:MAG: S24 family peptidase [Brachymonas sp.]
MSTARDRLESEINKFELSELANDLGVARNTIYNWMAKANTPLNYLVALKARGVDVEYIISGERSSAQNIEHAHTNENQPGTDEFIHVPRYDVQASAGNGSLVHDESVVDHLAFKRDWVVRTLGLDPKRLALIDVAGDSMSPTINDGDLILLDTRPAQSRTEGIYVINLGGSLLVKRIRMRLSGVVDVVSDNERYGTETISGEQLTSLQIVGRVVWQGRRV